MNDRTIINIEERIKAVQHRIKTACQIANRPTDSVALIGASKRKNSALIRKFAQYGLHNVGENYLQEALIKRSELEDTDLCWHFIGQIQSNKTKTIADNFSWVHGIDRLKIAQRISKQNPSPSSPINLLVQLNPDNEASKGGLSFAEAPELCEQISQLDHVNIRGFMMIPKARDSHEAQRAIFAKAKECLELANQRYGLAMDSLSMGMSGDLDAAITEGSTMVRVGTDLFGPRN